MGNFISTAIVLFGLLGWVLNIIAVAGSDTITGMVLVRVIGILFAPLGAVMGYI